jgi:hypothetical protein
MPEPIAEIDDLAIVDFGDPNLAVSLSRIAGPVDGDDAAVAGLDLFLRSASRGLPEIWRRSSFSVRCGMGLTAGWSRLVWPVKFFIAQ